MKSLKIAALLFIAAHVFSCQENTIKQKPITSKKVKNLPQDIDTHEVLSDFRTWWTYHATNISLSSNFTGFNEQMNPIEKKLFLKKLSTGNYIPIKVTSNSKAPAYQLFKLDDTVDKSIRNTIKSESLKSLKYANMEGQSLPTFEFEDLQGNVYTTENTKGKMMVLKTWFISCTACVAEFPELNEFVETQQKTKDVIFVSLALDEKVKLEEFLQKRTFKYQVVPNQKEYIRELNLHVYPTHLIIDKNGTIIKVVNKASEMIAFIKNKIELQSSKQIPPPPPI